jgi:hypothetical protein
MTTDERRDVKLIHAAPPAMRRGRGEGARRRERRVVKPSMTSEVRGRARGVPLTVRLAVERTRPKRRSRERKPAATPSAA